MAGLVVAILAGMVAFTTLSRAATQRSGAPDTQPTVSVVVAARPVAVRSPLSEDDVELKDVPVDTVPEGAVGQVEDAIGKITLVELYTGEIILSQRLVDPNVISGDGRMALVMTEDEVLMAFPAEDLMSRTGMLKPGDHVDLLFSLNFPVNRALLGAASSGEAAGVGASREEELATFDLLQNLTIAAIVTGQATTGGETDVPEAILLTVSPQDALVLKHVKDSDGILDIVLRAPGDDKPYETEPVDVDYLINRYKIPIVAGQ